MPEPSTFSQRLMGQAKDMGEYQSLKESDEKERAATRQLYESLRRKLGNDDAAKAALKSKGYDPNLLK